MLPAIKCQRNHFLLTGYAIHTCTYLPISEKNRMEGMTPLVRMRCLFYLVASYLRA